MPPSLLLSSLHSQMSRRNRRREEAHGDRGISTRRSPRFLQTPLRRSPRLHPQPNDVFPGDVRSQSKNKPKDRSRKQSGSKFSPISSDSSKRSSLKKRLNEGFGVRQESERRRSPRLALRSDAGLKAEEAVNIGGVVDLEERQENAAPIEGGKRKRIGGEKREEIQVDRGGEVEERGGGGGGEGWTKEQELELRRAYLLARPSPHFWKKVAKMVPGKSAQECFDRVHADLATPPQSHPVSRATKLDQTPIADFTLSSSIAALGCNKTNAKRPRRGKQKILFAQKAVRHLLRKHQVIDRSKEADLFSVLETTPTVLTMDFPEVKTPATPQCVPTPVGFLKRCSERSLSALKGTHSRFRPPDQANYMSPEVLKPIKNMVLHEKYINQLHCREAKRRTLAKTTSSVAARDSRNVTSLKPDLRAARTALLSEAKDAVTHFQHLQADPFGDHIDDDDDDDDDFDGFNSADDDE
ncbi:Myb-like domain-containing protein [Dioscorea alata]|uniref:Myb-like domain-containing protein n=1 Tax=Dioscorea alata TaxID=55571 RepID=A0ACB7VVG5_DIOAL|nr:Myb-like domain-containing protein [Dioscorea alata]